MADRDAAKIIFIPEKECPPLVTFPKVLSGGLTTEPQVTNSNDAQLTT